MCIHANNSSKYPFDSAFVLLENSEACLSSLTPFSPVEKMFGLRSRLINFCLEILFPSVCVHYQLSAQTITNLVKLVRTKEDSGVPCDLLLLRGSCIVNEAMLSGESTPLLKESVELRPAADNLDIDGLDRNSVLFGGTKVLQATGIDKADKIAGESINHIT